MSDGRPVELDEARGTWVRVYPIKGTPAVGLIPVVNDGLDLQFSSGFDLQGPALTDDSGNLLTDDDGNVLYADWPGFGDIWDRAFLAYQPVAAGGELVFGDDGDVVTILVEVP